METDPTRMCELPALSVASRAPDAANSVSASVVATVCDIRKLNLTVGEKRKRAGSCGGVPFFRCGGAPGL